jgi:hypothetical protein
MHLEHAILAEPATQQTLAAHRQHQAPCIYCGGAYAGVAIYFDPAMPLPNGQTFITFMNVCAACPGEADFMAKVDAEYRRDLTQACMQIERRRRGLWN